MVYIVVQRLILYSYTFEAVGISFDQLSYFASEAEGFITVTLISSLSFDFPYSIAISLLQ